MRRIIYIFSLLCIIFTVFGASLPTEEILNFDTSYLNQEDGINSYIWEYFHPTLFLSPDAFQSMAFSPEDRLLYEKRQSVDKSNDSDPWNLFFKAETMLFDSKLVAKNFSNIYSLFETAAEQGIGVAHAYLGILHGSGIISNNSSTPTAVKLNYWLAGLHNTTLGTLLLSKYYFQVSSIPQCLKGAFLMRNVAHDIKSQLIDIPLVGSGVLPLKNRDLYLYYDFPPTALKTKQMPLNKKDEDLMLSYQASAGSPYAHLELGKIHFLDALATNNNKTFAKALSHFEQASGELPLCYSIIGFMYLNGLGMKPNVPRALKILSQGVSLDDSFSKTLLARILLFDPAHVQTAFELLNEASQVDPSALYTLGVLWKHGYASKIPGKMYLSADHLKALHHFSRAAQVGHLASMVEFADLLLIQEMTPEFMQLIHNHPDSFLKANMAPLQKCQNGLFLYQQVVRELLYGSLMDEAFESSSLSLFQICTELGFPQAPLNVAWLYEKGHTLDGTPITKEQSQQAAYLYYKKTIILNPFSSRAFLKLGDYHYFGLGVEKDYETAFNYYKHSMQLRSPEGTYNLAYMFQHGIGVEKNIEKAIEYYTHASKDPTSKIVSKIALFFIRFSQFWEFNHQIIENCVIFFAITIISFFILKKVLFQRLLLRQQMVNNVNPNPDLNPQVYHNN